MTTHTARHNDNDGSQHDEDDDYDYKEVTTAQRR